MEPARPSRDDGGVGQLRVREATVADCERVAELLHQLGYPASASAVAERLAVAADAGSGVLVAARDDERCVGVVAHQHVYFFERGAPRCRITALAVDATVRGCGVGRMLITEVEARAVGAGCTALEVTSSYRPEREAAHRFYPALGFDDGAVRGAYYIKPIGSPA